MASEPLIRPYARYYQSRQRRSPDRLAYARGNSPTFPYALPNQHIEQYFSGQSNRFDLDAANHMMPTPPSPLQVACAVFLVRRWIT